MIYGVEGATVPYALAQLSARFKERGHSFRAASTWHWKLGPSETFGHLF